MRTSEPHRACHEPLLGWFSEAPEAMKFAQRCTNFLQRPTLWLHCDSKLLLNRPEDSKEWKASRAEASKERQKKARP